MVLFQHPLLVVRPLELEQVRAAVRGAKREIEDQTKNDGTKEEGVPGSESGLGRNPKLSLSEERCLSEIS